MLLQVKKKYALSPRDLQLRRNNYRAHERGYLCCDILRPEVSEASDQNGEDQRAALVRV